MRPSPRQVLHVALRSAKTDTFYDNGRNVVPDVHAVLDKIRIFSHAVRNGARPTCRLARVHGSALR